MWKAFFVHERIHRGRATKIEFTILLRSRMNFACVAKILVTKFHFASYIAAGKLLESVEGAQIVS